MAATLKLLVDKESNKVVYAEAGKEFVDFLLGLMEIPLGSVLRVLGNRGEIESLSFGKIYQSVKSLDSSFLQKQELRNSILDPKTPVSEVEQNSMLRDLFSPGSSTCGSRAFGYSSHVSSSLVDGYVKGAVTYMVMDDLTITPSSSISSINQFNTQRIKDMGTLQEKVVQVDDSKALELVRAAFQSRTVLTDIFMEKTDKKKIAFQGRSHGVLRGNLRSRR